jgi:hypothetical protein
LLLSGDAAPRVESLRQAVTRRREERPAPELRDRCRAHSASLDVQLSEDARGLVAVLAAEIGGKAQQQHPIQPGGAR